MTHNNRGRLTVALGGAWRLYSNTIPAGSRALGTITRDIGDTGALVQIESTGLYVQVNAGSVRTLPQSKVAAALAEVRTGKGGLGVVRASKLPTAQPASSAGTSALMMRARTSFASLATVICPWVSGVLLLISKPSNTAVKSDRPPAALVSLHFGSVVRPAAYLSARQLNGDMT